MTKLAGINLFKWLMKEKLFGIVKICNFVHDEIVLECPEDMAEKVRSKLEYFMEEAGKVFCPIIPVPAKPGIVDVWDH